MRPLSVCTNVDEVTIERLPKAAAVILAGGEGSRLGFSGPKGTFSLLGKTLFERLLETAPISLPIAILLSNQNEQATKRFFQDHDFFGREIHFFTQPERPYLDLLGRPLLQKGATGNGAFFKTFVDSGCCQRFLEAGMEAITVVPVDNPLTSLYDKTLLSFHTQQKAQVTIQCIEKSEGYSMGALLEDTTILEYLYQDPLVDYLYFYTGTQVLDLSWVFSVAQNALPFHFSKKKKRGKTLFKQEQFLFDAFSYAEKVQALCCPVKRCYAPLKEELHIEGAEQVLKKKIQKVVSNK